MADQSDTPPLDTDYHGDALDMSLHPTPVVVSMRRHGPVISFGLVGSINVVRLNPEQAEEIAKSLWAAAHLARADGQPDTLAEVTRDFLALTPEVEALKRRLGHASCDGWSLSGDPHVGRCGCGVPLDDLAALARDGGC